MRKLATDENQPETCRKTTARLGCRITLLIEIYLTLDTFHVFEEATVVQG
jgi:hypothetical protein